MAKYTLHVIPSRTEAAANEGCHELHILTELDTGKTKLELLSLANKGARVGPELRVATPTTAAYTRR
jgi:hypothetical protein